MFRRLIATLVAFVASVVLTLASTGLAFAAVDVNNADQTQLQTINGIGPAISAKIVAERKNGNFKDWDDLVKRVPGIGDKNSAKFSSGGLTVGGAMKPETRLDPSLMKRTNPATPAVPAAPVARAPATPAPAAPPALAKTPADPAPATTASTAKAPAAPAAPAPAKSAASPTKADVATPPAETKGKSSKAAKKEEAARKEDVAAASATTTATTAEQKVKKTRAKKGDAADTTDATPKK